MINNKFVRLCARYDGNEQCLMIGHSFGLLKPNMIYEISEHLGELTIKEIGECNDPKIWNRNIGDIIAMGYLHNLLMTNNESQNIQNKN